MLGMSCKTWYISNANKLGRGRVLGVFYIHLFKQKNLLNMCLILFKALDNHFALTSAIPFHLDLAVRNTTFSFIHQFLNFETIFFVFLYNFVIILPLENDKKETSVDDGKAQIKTTTSAYGQKVNELNMAYQSKLFVHTL